MGFLDKMRGRADAGDAERSEALHDGATPGAGSTSAAGEDDVAAVEEIGVRGLSAEEEASIRGAKNEFVWHLDLGATMLDLIGVWDDPTMTPFRRRMIGHPITRPERTVEPVPLTNCTWVWECAFRNWGLMQGPIKIEAREWDAEYHCFNLLDDPQELNNLGERACAPLPDLARRTFHVMPNITPPGRPHVDWGNN